MPGPDFLDTNVFVYAFDVTADVKRNAAQALIRRGVAGECVTSTQVFAELAATLLHKLRPAASPNDVVALLDVLGPIPLVAPDADMVRRAVEAHAKYGLHFYDGMIIAAAERANCEKLWSEDLNPGQKYFGVLVVDPFA